METQDEQQEEYDGCECELDWNCGRHAHRLYTAAELQADAWAKQETDPYDSAGWR